MVIDLHAKNQLNISKHLGKKSEKLILRTDRWRDGQTNRRTDRRTECKPKVPFSFAGRGLKNNKSGKLSQDTPILPQVVTIQEISWP